jgi:hypothetical protein
VSARLPSTGDHSADLAVRPHLQPLFWLLQGLNALDAALTEFAVASGMADEANPLVRTIDWPGKLALVFVAGWLLAALRPRTLMIPIVALSCALAWTSAGILLSA